jgi:sporulation protein YlmC with PRC-barrel domain
MDALRRKGTAMRRWWGLVGAALFVMAADPVPEVTKADATGVLSRMVRDEDGKEIGRIVDVVVDPTGQPRAIVVDVGGFMGLGARRVAVSWPSVHVPSPDAADKRVAIDLTDAQVRSAPEYTDRTKPASIVGPPAPPVPAADNEK